MAHILVIASYPESLVLFRGDLLRTLVACGHRVTAVAGEISPSVEQALSRMSVRYLTVFLNRTGLDALADIRSLWSLYRLVRNERPDVVLSYTAKPVIYGSLAAQLAGIERIYSMITGLGYAFDESVPTGRYARWLIRRLYALALRFNERVLVQNPDDLEELIRTRCLASSSRTAVVNGSGVDLNHYAAVPLPASGPSFLMIARLLANKGVREYVDAARVVRQSCPQARCVLIGWFDNHPTSIKRSEMQTWQSEGVIEYAGPVEDVRPYLRQCSVYVLPSYREGTPRTVLEAMSTGRAVITTDVPGCRETIVNGVNGFLVPPRNAKALVDAMLRLASDSKLTECMGIEGRRIAERKYDVRLVTRSVMDAMGLAC